MKKLIIIDYNVTAASPSMKGMLRVLPALLEGGWQVEVWSHAFTSPDSRIAWKRFPGIPGPGMLKFVGFSLLVHWQWFKWQLKNRSGEKVLWQSTGTYLLPADVVCIHFISSFYLRQMRSRGMPVAFHETVLHRLVSGLEQVQRWIPRRNRHWFVVSRRLAEDLQSESGLQDVFQLLPNSFDDRRWNRTVRSSAREEVRARFGYGEGNCVFAFVGLGSFVRKGLPMALQVCSRLNAAGLPVKLLVIGGADASAPDLTQLAAEHGVNDLSFVRTHGRTPDVPQLLSACEGLLFPSFFEAFSLVEIEAAALGLRLYLTPHYGSEMLLKDGVNGRLLPWDVEGAVRVLEEDVRSGAVWEDGAFDSGALIPDGQYGRIYQHLLDEAWQAVHPGASPSGEPEKSGA